jgi:hypothetical protein
MASENYFPHLTNADNANGSEPSDTPPSYDFADRIRARLVDLQSQLDRRIELHTPQAESAVLLSEPPGPDAAATTMDNRTESHIEASTIDHVAGPDELVGNAAAEIEAGEPVLDPGERICAMGFISRDSEASQPGSVEKEPWMFASVRQIIDAHSKVHAEKLAEKEADNTVEVSEESEVENVSETPALAGQPVAAAALEAPPAVVHVPTVDVEQLLEEERAIFRAERAKMVAEMRIQAAEVIHRAEQEASLMLARAQETIDAKLAFVNEAYARQAAGIQELEAHYDAILVRMHTLLQQQIASLPRPSSVVDKTGAVSDPRDPKAAGKPENGANGRGNGGSPTTHPVSWSGESTGARMPGEPQTESVLRHLPKHYRQEF